MESLLWHTKKYLTQKEVVKEAQRNTNPKRHKRQMANINPTMSIIKCEWSKQTKEKADSVRLDNKTTICCQQETFYIQD